MCDPYFFPTVQNIFMLELLPLVLLSDRREHCSSAIQEANPGCGPGERNEAINSLCMKQKWR